MKIQNILWAILLASTVLTACGPSGPKPSEGTNTTEEELPVVEREAFQNSPLDSVYAQLRPTTQRYSIDANSTQTIQSSNGMEVLIPAQSFVDAQGNPVTGKVEIEIIEANTLADFLSCELQTLSNNRVLESAGMLFIDAKSNGQSLQIAEGQKIAISMPMMKAEDGFQMFTGATNEDGSLNWIEDRSTDKEYLIPFPPQMLEDLTFYYGWEGYYGFWSNSLDTIKYNPYNPKYENTFVQTREFQERFQKLHLASVLISSILNKDLRYGDWENNQLDNQLFELYFNNLETDIEILDSQATIVVTSFLHSNEFKEFIASPKATNSLAYWYFQNYSEQAWKDWLDFGSDNAKGNVPEVKDYGVDLSLDNAYDLLTAKGASQDEALTILNIERERNNYIEEQKRIMEAREKQQEMQQFIQETVFSTSQLGWINCDRFLNDPNAGKAEIIVSIDSESPVDYVDCSLILPDLNVKLSAFPIENGQYSFTKSNGVYTNLPIGKEALIVGVSLVDGKTQFASQKITIQEKAAVSLEMKAISTEELKGAIESLLQNEAS